MGGNRTFVKCLDENEFLVGRVESSLVRGWCSMRKVGRPGYWIILSLIWWIHATMEFSYWPTWPWCGEDNALMS